MKTAMFSFLFILAAAGLCIGTKQTNRTADPFGLIIDDVAYHLLCDQGEATPFNPSVPRACFETRFHVAENLRNPKPSKLNGSIDGSGKNFVLLPDAVVTLRNLEIHVNHSTTLVCKEQDRSCTAVEVYRLPQRDVQAHLTWCPGVLLPIML